MSKRCLILPGAALVTVAMLPPSTSASVTSQNPTAATIGGTSQAGGHHLPVADAYNSGYSIGYDDGLNCSTTNWSSSKSKAWKNGYNDGNDEGALDAGCD